MSQKVSTLSCHSFKIDCKAVQNLSSKVKINVLMKLIFTATDLHLVLLVFCFME